MLNDPTYVEAARAFAARILAAKADDKFDWAFREAFARPATPEEKAVLAKLLDRARGEFHKNAQAAEELLATGIAPNPAKADEAELAAWTSIARALLNKHEFVMRY